MAEIILHCGKYGNFVDEKTMKIIKDIGSDRSEHFAENMLSDVTQTERNSCAQYN